MFKRFAPAAQASIRLALVLATGLACLLALDSPRWAHAQETQTFPCGPLEDANQIAQALGGEDFVALSAEQWQFARGLCDRAAISLRPDGSASLVSLDGDLACAPIKLDKDGFALLTQVGRGELVHAGRNI